MKYQLEELRQVSLPERFLCFPLVCCGVCLCGCGLNLAYPSRMGHAKRAKGPSNSGAQGGLQRTGAPRGAEGPRVVTRVLTAQPQRRVVIVETMTSPEAVGRLCCGRCSTSDRGPSPPPHVEVVR